MARLCLNSIVKNESGRIERMLDSVTQFIDCAVIVDTGSTDKTKEIISEYFKYHKIPCILGTAPFINWSQARNEALKLARWARKTGKLEFDYMLLNDADMQLIVKDRSCFDNLIGDSYDMYQQAGALHYQNRRLVRWDTEGQYVGVTHEYLGVDSYGCIPDTKATFYDHADGANRPKKYKRDIRLLLQGLKDEPENARYMFYLAQSYRDAGRHKEAAKWYRKRVEAGGWDEEVWNAEVNYAHTMLSLGKPNDFIAHLLKAHDMRPSRAETLYDLAHYYRDKGMNTAAVTIAEAGVNIPLSKDALFVNDFVYKNGLKEEISICAFYVPGKRRRGFEISNEIALQRSPYSHSRELAKHNLYHYIVPLGEHCPSFKSKILWESPDPFWTAMNPSVTAHNNELFAVIRTVNYRMDEHGRYLIRSTEGEANNTNPINTRNQLARLNEDLSVESVAEIKHPSDMPAPQFLPVIGFEDMRLFSWDGELCTSSTVREMNYEGYCEQVLAFISTSEPDAPVLCDWKRMLKQPRLYEKNWAPIVDGNDLKFMYRPGEVIDHNAQEVCKHDTGLETVAFSGSSQLVPYGGDWLAVIHEARTLPGSHLRYYWHRFVLYDSGFAIRKISLPFVFDEKVIEFAAGMCVHPTTGDLVISYGSRDAAAKIATVKAHEVRTFLDQS